MTLFLVIAALVGVGYLAVNVGSKEKVPFTKIAVPMVVVCLAAYFAYPYFAPVVTQLLRLSHHL